jgi:hypothetical protein
MAGSARKTNVKNSSQRLEFFSCKDFEKEMPSRNRVRDDKGGGHDKGGRHDIERR